jgi:hypothetical protein
MDEGLVEQSCDKEVLCKKAVPCVVRLSRIYID